MCTYTKSSAPGLMPSLTRDFCCPMCYQSFTHGDQRVKPTHDGLCDENLFYKHYRKYNTVVEAKAAAKDKEAS